MSVEQSGEQRALSPAELAEANYDAAVDAYYSAVENLEIAEELYRRTAVELFAGQSVNIGYSTIRSSSSYLAETKGHGRNEIMRITGVIFQKSSEFSRRKSLFLRVNRDTASGFWVHNMAQVEVVDQPTES